jgi:hypothetical protein
MAGKTSPKLATGGAPRVLEAIKNATAATCESILNLPIFEAAMTTPSAAATERRPVTASSRPMMMQTAQAGASRFSTSEMSAAEMSSLSAMGSRSVPRRETCWRLRAICPSR